MIQSFIAYASSNPEVVYVVSNTSIIKRSNNQGETWTTSYPELPIQINAVNEIDLDPLNPFSKSS